MCDNEGRKDGRSKLRHKVPANHDPPTGTIITTEN